MLFIPTFFIDTEIPSIRCVQIEWCISILPNFNKSTLNQFDSSKNHRFAKKWLEVPEQKDQAEEKMQIIEIGDKGATKDKIEIV